jgi:hypothetical protein
LATHALTWADALVPVPDSMPLEIMGPLAAASPPAPAPSSTPHVLFPGTPSSSTVPEPSASPP